MSQSLYKQIVSNGDYQVVETYAGKDAMVEFVTSALIEAIESVAGEATAKALRAAGAEHMHEFVDPDMVTNLQTILDDKLKAPLLRITKSLAKESLGLGDDFYLDLKVISRIKFPFEVARKSKVGYLDYAKEQGRTTFQKPPELTIGYHRNLPFPAWAHGPHADSWFGHSYDGINLWWAIAGVTEESGMTFYPDYVGDDSLPVIEEPPYLVKDHPLPKPVFFNLNPGDVIAFNSDTLHGTRVNFSGKTRFSLSTRINPEAPRFNLEQFRHVQYWVKSDDLEKMLGFAVPTGEQSLRTDSAFDMKSNPHITIAKKEDKGTCEGVFGNSCKKSLVIPSAKVVFETWEDGQVCLGDVHKLDENEKLLVQVGKENIVVARTSKGLRALAAICPHIGYNLGYGGHDDAHVYCNGHGLAFDWDTGKSGSELYKVKTYSVEETKNGIFLFSK